MKRWDPGYAQVPRNVSWRTVKRAALIFLPLAIAGVVVSYLLYASQASTVRAIAQSTETRIIDIARQRITLTIATTIGDANYLSEQDALRTFLANGDQESRRHLQAEYNNFMKNRQFFDRLRFIDTRGQEVVRVDRIGTAIQIVPSDQLQNRADSGYVIQTLKLDRAQSFVSPIELDAERGAIEQPIKPTIRIGVPVFDEAGKKRGLIVINYLAQRILDRVAELDSTTAGIWMLNQDGYWLLGPEESAFAFMYPDRKDRSFAAAYPEIWRQMQSSPAAGQITSELGRFTYARAEAAEQSGNVNPSGPTWFALVYTPTSFSDAQTGHLRWSFIGASAGLLVLLAGVSLGLGSYQIHRLDAERRIRFNEARFRDLLESAPDAILITDVEGRIQLANAQAELLFGYPRNELVGRAIEMLLPERYRGSHVGHRQGYVGAARTRPMGAGLLLYGLRKDGAEFPVSISLSPTETAEGLAVFCAVRDISEQRSAEARIQDLNKRLQIDNAELAAVNKELEAFSYSVSHDLRAPLRAIDGFSQALIEDAGPLLNAEHHSHLNRVRQAAQRMGLLIDDLIKLARVTRSEVNIADVDLSEMAQEIAAHLQDTAPQRQAEFVIAPGLEVRGDPRLLHVALDNLLNNSWKFTAPRAPARIELGKIESNGQPTFFIRDNGVGFDMNYAGKMFGAFQRFHDAREFAGTGIGLATVQRIIHKHGGRIWAKSRPGEGATFFFTL